MELKITYVFHNCFIIEWNDEIILFDYPEIISNRAREYVKGKVIGKKLAILISHSHLDHFSEELLEFKTLAKDFKCIVSADVAEKSEKCLNECLVVNEGVKFEIWDIEGKAYGSSDLGVSFLLKIGGIKIYFAGDNADWRRKELPSVIGELVWNVFSKTIREVRNDVGELDIAFIDVCEICENLGGVFYIIEELKPKLIIPMHLYGNIKILKDIANFLRNFKTKVFAYNKIGSTKVLT